MRKNERSMIYYLHQQGIIYDAVVDFDVPFDRNATKHTEGQQDTHHPSVCPLAPLDILTPIRTHQMTPLY